MKHTCSVYEGSSGLLSPGNGVRKSLISCQFRESETFPPGATVYLDAIGSGKGTLRLHSAIVVDEYRVMNSSQMHSPIGGRAGDGVARSVLIFLVTSLSAAALENLAGCSIREQSAYLKHYNAIVMPDEQPQPQIASTPPGDLWRREASVNDGGERR